MKTHQSSPTPPTFELTVDLPLSSSLQRDTVISFGNQSVALSDTPLITHRCDYVFEVDGDNVLEKPVPCYNLYQVWDTFTWCLLQHVDAPTKALTEALKVHSKPVPCRNLLDTMYKTACLYSALHVERCEEMHFIKSWMPHCLNALADRNIRHDDMHWMEISVYQFQGDN